MNNYFIDKTVLLSWVQLSDQLGINSTEILETLSIDLQQQPISFTQFSAFVQKLLDQLPASVDIGILLGEQSNIAALGLVGQLIQSSSSIQQGLENAIRFFDLFSNVLKLELEVNTEVASIKFLFSPHLLKEEKIASQQLLLFSLIFAVKEVYFLTLQKYSPLMIDLGFTIQNKDYLKQVVQCQINYDATQTVLYFDRKILELKTMNADYKLLMSLEALACERLTKLMGEVTYFSLEVKKVIYKLLSPAFPSISEVAHQFNMSERNLQRKLKEEQSTYSSLIIEIKKELAHDFLIQEFPIKEIAYLLGYSEASSFINAFRNWFNCSPTDYKNNVLNSDNVVKC